LHRNTATLLNFQDSVHAVKSLGLATALPLSFDLIADILAQRRPVPTEFQPTPRPVDTRLYSATHEHHWRFGLATQHRTDTCIQRRYDLLYLSACLQVGWTDDGAQGQTASSLLDDFPVQVDDFSNALDTIIFGSFLSATGFIRKVPRDLYLEGPNNPF
jgi:hypothetical protein